MSHRAAAKDLVPRKLNPERLKLPVTDRPGTEPRYNFAVIGLAVIPKGPGSGNLAQEAKQSRPWSLRIKSTPRWLHGGLIFQLWPHVYFVF